MMRGRLERKSDFGERFAPRARRRRIFVLRERGKTDFLKITDLFSPMAKESASKQAVTDTKKALELALSAINKT
ncbi:MAG: hypothetical protein ACI4P3_05775, partial [Candidatus Spyradosoma sp.]